MAHNVIHFEVLGQDAAALQRFYGEAFGWEMQDVMDGGYYMVNTGGGIAGGVGSAMGGAGHVTFYVEVDDLAAEVLASRSWSVARSSLRWTFRTDPRSLCSPIPRAMSSASSRGCDGRGPGSPGRATPSAGPGTPTLYVCHGDDQGPRIHPCRRVQEAMRAAGISPTTRWSPLTAARSRSCARAPGRSSGRRRADQLLALRLPDGRVLIHSRSILKWAGKPGPSGS